MGRAEHVRAMGVGGEVARPVCRRAEVAGRLRGSVAARVEKGIGRSCGSGAAVPASVGWTAAMARCILGVEGSTCLVAVESTFYVGGGSGRVGGWWRCGGGVGEGRCRAWVGWQRLEFVRVGGVVLAWRRGDS